MTEKELRDKAWGNMFSADHRNKMIAQYDFTAAMFVSLDSLCFEATMEAEYRQRDTESNPV
jgi:hypothetical protein